MVWSTRQRHSTRLRASLGTRLPSLLGTCKMRIKLDVVADVIPSFIVLQHDLYEVTVDLAVGYTLNAALTHNPPFSVSVRRW